MPSFDLTSWFIILVISPQVNNQIRLQLNYQKLINKNRISNDSRKVSVFLSHRLQRFQPQASKTEEIPCKLVKPKPFLWKDPKIHVHIIFKFTSLTSLTAPVEP